MKQVKLDFQRFEIKYRLPRILVSTVAGELLEHNLVRDPYVENSSDHSYSVTSLYFDSPSLLCFHSKAAGAKRRFKLRLRIYGERLEEVDRVFVEVKRRENAVVIKRRAVFSPEQARAAFEWGAGAQALDDSDGGNRPAIEEFLRLQRAHGMIPMVNVSYRRQPLIGRFNPGLRVTFDDRLVVSSAPRISLVQRLPTDLRETVMEVKFNNALPDWFQSIIRRYGLERESISKYALAVITASRLGHLPYS